MSEHVRSRLAEVRQARGVAASELARRVGVSRQTIYAIESGDYVPNTAVALRVARVLEVTVEELFSLPAEQDHAKEQVTAEVLSAQKPATGQAVRICRVGDRRVCVPVSASPYYLPEADGVIAKPGSGGKSSLAVFSREENSSKKLVLAGCDPATGLLARLVERASGIEIVAAAASSRLALEWLKEGKVHIAGSHLEDPSTGEFNLPFVDTGQMTVLTFARWEEGWVTAPGNPLELQAVEDLARVRIINREEGSGARALLDRLIKKAGIPAKKMEGYGRIAFGHLAAAYAVMSGGADCCLATRSAAQTFGLGFVPIHSERYDLVLNRQTVETQAAQAFLDVLQRSELRRKLELLAGYDTSETGRVLV